MASAAKREEGTVCLLRVRCHLQTRMPGRADAPSGPSKALIGGLTGGCAALLVTGLAVLYLMREHVLMLCGRRSDSVRMKDVQLSMQKAPSSGLIVQV